MPTATPTASPANLPLARQFDQQGQVDEATGAYLAVIAKGAPPERLAARMALARLYLSQGSSALAAHQLDAYLFEAPANANVADAQFMLARARSATSDDANALALYGAYIQAGGPAVTYARIGRAESLASGGDTAQALSEANSVLGSDLPPSVRTAFELQMAQALESTSPTDAIGWYGRLSNDSSAPSDQALAIWRSAVLGGDVNQEYSSWVNVLTDYSDTPTAREIVGKPPPIQAPAPLIDPYNRALVYYYAGENEKARVSFEQVIINQESSSADAAFYLGALDERDGAPDDAIDHYSQVVQLNPQSSHAGDALWWEGRLLEEAGRRDAAGAAYNKIVSDYSGSSFADDARFRLGLLAYDAGRYADAAGAFDAIATASHDDVQARALVWQAKSLSAAGQEKQSQAALEKVQQQAPDSYYGLRAAVLLGNASGKLKNDGVAAPGEIDWTAIESWLSSQEAPPALLAQQALFANPHWNEGNALLSLGLARQASAEFGLLLDRASGNSAMLLALSRYFSSVGEFDLSSEAAARLLAEVPPPAVENAPPDLWRLAYPAPFLDATEKAADAEDVPPVLLLALVRQESVFDPLAGSTAGAIGLTQVTPATGAAIASDLKLAKFDPSQLLRPEPSLHFGAHYLRQQLDAFHGDIYAALAAYNAGPNAGRRWQQAAGGDVDRFVAEIDFAQTQSYVKLVTENLARYRQLYQGLAQPALPKD